MIKARYKDSKGREQKQDYDIMRVRASSTSDDDD
jgi:hypothetical protein